MHIIIMFILHVKWFNIVDINFFLLMQVNTDHASLVADTILLAAAGDKTEDTPSTHTSTPPLSQSADIIAMIIVPSTTPSTADSTQPKLHIQGS